MRAAPAIADYLAARREIVIEQIRRFVPRDARHTGGLYDLMLDYPLRPGKAIRPALSIAVCRGAGGTLAAVLPTAAVLELYHNAFLVHDDVEDRSCKRRHEETLNRRHGVPAAVNVGDGMLALAMRPLLDNIELVGLGKALKILQVVARMARESAEGQMIELHWIAAARWDQRDADYTRLVYKKTAWYSFVAPMMIGAISAGLGDAATAFGRAGIPLGIAFQIQDDILNIAADAETYGKDRYADLWEGKHTLILVHALRCAPCRERDEALRILAKRQPLESEEARGETAVDARTKSDVSFLTSVIERSGSLAYAAAVAERYARRFRRELEGLVRHWPSSEHRDFLFELSDYVIRRAV